MAQSQALVGLCVTEQLLDLKPPKAPVFCASSILGVILFLLSCLSVSHPLHGLLPLLDHRQTHFLVPGSNELCVNLIY